MATPCGRWQRLAWPARRRCSPPRGSTKRGGCCLPCAAHGLPDDDSLMECILHSQRWPKRPFSRPRPRRLSFPRPIAARALPFSNLRRRCPDPQRRRRPVPHRWQRRRPLMPASTY
ncbi:hypothetical protein BDA96_09G134700 [Sorghum bicolor]|uniref:Uncharacterized protein n=1 Tax=Sorghum bicolor TaxID=4558 RepID=A0A921QA92_SORBI|nr:hypothetical protein BDA96_09G134700 [Sorghum bicolor]